jgi:hypothetical protein
MNFFTVISYSVLMLVLGYMLGRSDGRQEGYLDGVAAEYKAAQER